MMSESRNLVSDLFNELSEKGCKARILSIDHLEDLKADIKEVFEVNGLSDSFRTFIDNCHSFSFPDNLTSSKSIIITAVSSPRVEVIFNYRGRKIPVFIPPTYIDMFSTPENIMKYIKAFVEPLNYNVVRARLPEKLLAVRSGLGFYGRNNVCYVPELGSFVKLSAFFTDIPCQEDNWHEVKQMETCRNCFVCSNRCPTGSIMKERTLINAERCICYMNEHVGVFPDWIDKSWHNSIVGCFLCQEACPENRKNLGNIVRMYEFSDEETEMLLSGVPLESIHAETRTKLEKINMIVYYKCMPRNLKVLFEKVVGDF